MRRSTTNPNLEYHIAQTIRMDRKNEWKSADELNLIGGGGSGSSSIHGTRSCSSPALLSRKGNVPHQSSVASYDHVGRKDDHSRFPSIVAVAENKRGYLKTAADQSLQMDTIYRENSTGSDKSVAASEGGSIRKAVNSEDDEMWMIDYKQTILQRKAKQASTPSPNEI